jgi:hypothetical protein
MIAAERNKSPELLRRPLPIDIAVLRAWHARRFEQPHESRLNSLACCFQQNLDQRKIYF